MSLKNKIVNYFAIQSLGEGTKVVRSPVTISSLVARGLIEKQFKRQIKGQIFHVCFDVDSRILYLPNASGFSQDQLNELLESVKLRISKDFEDGHRFGILIKGSPFSSLRLRSINSFDQAREIIKRHHRNCEFGDLDIVEANLAKMPTTLKLLPNRYSSNEESIGGYVGVKDANAISFIEEYDLYGKKLENPVTLLTLKTPFILIDISETKKKKTPTATEKETVILNGYRDHFYSSKLHGGDSMAKFADQYAISRCLQLGWPFEEVCSYMLRDKIKGFGELMNAIGILMAEANSLKADGYGDASKFPYYITFKIDESFPLRLSSVTNKETGKIDLTKQYCNFLILDYDNNSSYVTIQSPVFISPTICYKVLKAQSYPFICKYNSTENVVDIKSGEKICKEMPKRQLHIIKMDIKKQIDSSKYKELKFRSGEMANGSSTINPNVYTIRKVSDYYYSFDILKKLCLDKSLPFVDLDVVIGPIEQVLGSGVHGGFMGKKSFDKSKLKAPFKLAKGVMITPPVILLDSVSYPSYADQTEVLIHEYTHFIYELKNQDYENQYGKDKDHGYKYWHLYFSDPSEKMAHKNQIKFEFALGKSYDEIIRNKVGGEITSYNYPIALKFSELVEDAMKELEEKKDEYITG